MTDEQILATWNNFTDYSGHCRNIFAFARALLAASTPNNGNVAAWMTEDGRVISAEQKAGAERDGGASASSVQPYRIALVVEAASDKQEAISNEAAMQWVERHNLIPSFETMNPLAAQLTMREVCTCSTPPLALLRKMMR